MNLPNWHELFRTHLYVLLFAATYLEGLGLPLPAEALFLPAGGVVQSGSASLGGVIAVAFSGNVLGSVSGFLLAYAGGRKLVNRLTRLSRVKAEAVETVEAFFLKYGALTIFLSRFIGVIRAAAIYASGAAGMEPWRFALFLAAAALIWNAAWAWLAYRFGQILPHLLDKILAPEMVWILVPVLLLVGVYCIRWFGKKAA